MVGEGVVAAGKQGEQREVGINMAGAEGREEKGLDTGACVGADKKEVGENVAGAEGYGSREVSERKKWTQMW